jgi:hypothetical protein
MRPTRSSYQDVRRNSSQKITELSGFPDATFDYAFTKGLTALKPIVDRTNARSSLSRSGSYRGFPNRKQLQERKNKSFEKTFQLGKEKLRSSRLLFLAQFLESGIGAQWVPQRIQVKIAAGRTIGHFEKMWQRGHCGVDIASLRLN